MVRSDWTLAAAGLSLAEGRHVRRADGGAAEGRRLNNPSRFQIPGMQQVSGYMKEDDSDAWDGDGYVCRTRNECKKQATRDGASFYTDDYSNINTYGCSSHSGGLYMAEGEELERRLDISHILTVAGTFTDYVCSPSESKGRPLVSFLFFTIYVVLNAFIINSLMVGIIVMGMFR